MDLHVPTYFHDRISKAVARSDPVSVKLDLLGTPGHKLYVTLGQKKKIQEAIAKGRRDMTLRLSAKQVKHNIKSEGGFLAGLLRGEPRGSSSISGRPRFFSQSSFFPPLSSLHGDDENSLHLL